MLPGSLKEAIEAFEGDFARRALGDHVYDSLLRNKIIEYDNYRRHVTDYEMDQATSSVPASPAEYRQLQRDEIERI